MNSNSTFTFRGYSLNLEKGQAVFSYQLETFVKNYTFNETISFDVGKITKNINPVALERSMNNLLLILGISYYKTYCPKIIKISNFSLTKKQAEFWNLIYTKGLGE